MAGRSVPGARVKEQTSAGLVIHGCRMLATLPFADELMVFPSTLLRNQDEDFPYAFGLCLSTDTPGLKFLCRESLDYGRSHYDHPFGSRFEELDSVVMFDDVFVPWERVLLYRDVTRCNAAYARTGALALMAHQVVVKNLAKTEYLLGLASLLTHSIGIEVFQHIQEKLAEIWVNMETMRAFLRAAEADAAIDEYGMMRPAWIPGCRAQSLPPAVSSDDRDHPADRRERAGGHADGGGCEWADGRRNRALFPGGQGRGARSDSVVPAGMGHGGFRIRFGQVLYERFFFGDPVRMAGALVASHDRRAYMDRVRDFLAQSKSEAQSEASLRGSTE